ncbi:hypothetical protein D3C76_794840 [compost metagenome]
MPVTDIEVDHIDDKAVPQTVEQIAQRAANDQRVGDVVQLLRRFRAIHHNRQNYADTECDACEEPALPAAAVGEEAKRCAIVARVMQIK